jgi:hypothetical protein
MERTRKAGPSFFLPFQADIAACNTLRLHLTRTQGQVEGGRKGWREGDNLIKVLQLGWIRSDTWITLSRQTGVEVSGLCCLSGPDLVINISRRHCQLIIA